MGHLGGIRREMWPPHNGPGPHKQLPKCDGVRCWRLLLTLPPPKPVYKHVFEQFQTSCDAVFGRPLEPDQRRGWGGGLANRLKGPLSAELQWTTGHVLHMRPLWRASGPLQPFGPQRPLHSDPSTPRASTMGRRHAGVAVQCAWCIFHNAAYYCWSRLRLLTVMRNSS